MEKVLLILESDDAKMLLKNALIEYQIESYITPDATEALRIQAIPDPHDDETIVADLLDKFRLHGKPRVIAVLQVGILIVLRNPDSMLTKDVYPVLCKLYESSQDSVDQAIRRMLRGTWKRREDNKAIWDTVFPGHTKCPTNGGFITTVALYLRKKYPSRFRKGSRLS